MAGGGSGLFSQYLNDDDDKKMPAIIKALLSLENIDRYVNVKHYRKKEIIIKEGEPGNRVYVLMKGVVMTYRTAPTGQQRMLQFFVPIDLYGNITLVEDFVHTMTAEAVEPCVNLEIDKEFVKRMMHEKPEILWYFYTDLAKKLRITTEIIEDSYLTAEQRIYKGLIRLSSQFGYKTERGIELRIHLTQENLARYTGTTRVTVAKTIGHLVHCNILRTKPKPWVICRMDELMHLMYDRQPPDRKNGRFETGSG